MTKRFRRGTRVAVIDGDVRFRDELVRTLGANGYDAEGFDSVEALLDFEAFVSIDIALLDWRLSGVSGLDALLEVKRRRLDLPVVFHTANPLSAHEVLALSHGAADFIDKGRGLQILLRRLAIVASAMPASSATQDDAVQQYGHLVMKRDIKRAYWNGADLNLTVGEYDVLQLLMQSSGRLVSYRAIYDCMRSPGFVAGSGERGHHVNVRCHIMRLRKKFKRHDSTFDAIKSHAGQGYSWKRLAGPATTDSGDERPANKRRTKDASAVQ